MKTMIIISVLLASSSLAGVNIIPTISHGPNDYTELYHVNIGGSLSSKCIIVREGMVCDLHSPDGICCIKERKK